MFANLICIEKSLRWSTYENILSLKDLAVRDHAKCLCDGTTLECEYVREYINNGFDCCISDEGD